MLIKSKKILVLFIFLIILSCSKKSSDTLLEDMAQIDYNYAYTLMKTKESDRTSSIEIISDFSNDWSQFRKYYYNINSEDYFWKNDITRISDTIIRVNYFVSEDEDISAGYFILHDIKDILSDIRKRNNVDWAFDYLSNIYKITMRLNELAVTYSRQQYITEEERSRIISIYLSLDNKSKEFLSKVENNTFELYKFTFAQKNALLENARKLDRVVFDMGVHFVNADCLEISKATENILNIYFDILKIYASLYMPLE